VCYNDGVPVPVPKPIPVIGDDNGRIFQPDQLFKVPSLKIITQEKERGEAENFYQKSTSF
jgi:hypothetical protein